MIDRVLTRRVLLGSIGLIVGAAGAACLGGLPIDSTARGIARSPEALLGLNEQTHRPYWLLRGEPGWLGSHEATFSGKDSTGDSIDLAVRVAHFVDAGAASAAAGAVMPIYLHRLFRTRLPGPPHPVSDPLPSSGRTQRLYQIPAPIDQPEAAAGLFLVSAGGENVLLLEATGVPSMHLATWADALLADPA